ncbi:sensor histidine kinase [Pseudoduganella violacea]|uniref:histidine kinase n=1 Tax=Pseudoduganella violacea TaxID=1715466 RepID=A0A7W5BF85_9BURK|nr:ATP-binding protein [Pseudoduganella violacea]MBB3121796.1 signal transduction histidine kinase [Pseudoduganella violacea]
MTLSMPMFGRRTLVRRVMLALLAAFCLVWIVLLARDFINETDSARFDERVLTLGNRLSGMLAKAKNDDEARAIIATTSTLVNASYREHNVPGIMLMQLYGADGAPLYRSPESGATRLGQAGRQLSDVMVDGQPFRLYQQQAGGRTLRLGAQIIQRNWILQRMGIDLAISMLIALPLVVLPLWLAVRRGLRPLQQLSDQITAKGLHDLEPLTAVPEYEEIKPLAAALDTLLTRLRHKIAREARFVQDAAHELRTPMAVISAQAHVLALAPDARQRAEAEQQLDQAVARSSHLVQQLLEMALFERELEQHAPLEKLDAAQLAQQAIADVAPAAMRRDIELSLEAPDTLLHALDRHAFLSILHNLLHNAVHYIQEGGQVRVELLRLAADGPLMLAVTDNGPGIAPAEQALVFERFYRCAGQNMPGSGLGLSIVQQAAMRLRGTVQLTTTPQSGGCRFVIEIPA